MNRIKILFRRRSGHKGVAAAEYEPLRTSGDDAVDGQERGGEAHHAATAEVPFSWFEYTIFALVGVAMLWAWY